MDTQKYLEALLEATKKQTIKWSQHTQVPLGAFTTNSANGEHFQSQIVQYADNTFKVDVFQINPQGQPTALVHIDVTNNPIGVELYNAAIESVERTFISKLPNLLKSLKPEKKAAKVATLGNVEPEKN